MKYFAVWNKKTKVYHSFFEWFCWFST